MTEQQSNIQTINVPLPVGSRVTLTESVEVDSDEGVFTSITFEGYVERYVPETGLIEFADSNVRYAEFIELVEDADSIEIITDYEEV